MFFFDHQRIVHCVEEEIPEKEWVVRAMNGDEEAFVRLAERYEAKVWTMASRFARSRPELEDLVQDLFVRVWRGLPSYRAQAPFEHWLMSVAVRGCYDFLRKHRRRRESERPLGPAEGRGTVDEAEERARERRQASEIVALLLEQLAPRDQVLVTLLELEGRSVRETAGLTGLSESNVKVRAHRARKRMREIFTQLNLER